MVLHAPVVPCTFVQDVSPSLASLIMNAGMLCLRRAGCCTCCTVEPLAISSGVIADFSTVVCVRETRGAEAPNGTMLHVFRCARAASCVASCLLATTITHCICHLVTSCSCRTQWLWQQLEAAELFSSADGLCVHAAVCCLCCLHTETESMQACECVVCVRVCCTCSFLCGTGAHA